MSYLNHLPAKWWRGTTKAGHWIIRLGSVGFMHDGEYVIMLGDDMPISLTDEEVIELASDLVAMMGDKFSDEG